jgi:hypothetical protein
MARKAQIAAVVVVFSLSRLRERVGERVLPQRGTPDVERTLTRRYAATSPASGRG